MEEVAENPVDKVDCGWAEEKELAARVFRLIPAMNFLSKSLSMAVRLPSGVERLAESRSMLDKKLCELFMVVAGKEVAEKEVAEKSVSLSWNSSNTALVL